MQDNVSWSYPTSLQHTLASRAPIISPSRVHDLLFIYKPTSPVSVVHMLILWDMGHLPVVICPSSTLGRPPQSMLEFFTDLILCRSYVGSQLLWGHIVTTIFRGQNFTELIPLLWFMAWGGTLAGLAGRPQRVGDREICHAQRVGYRVYLVRTGKGIRPQF